jgi:hypothetical protein
MSRVILSPEQVQIIAGMANPYDYNNFLQACRQKNLMVITMADYLDSVGTLLSNKRRAVIDEKKLSSMGTNNVPVKSCCGGGGQTL